MSMNQIIDSPLPWALAGLAIGFFLGVTTLSVWILAAGFGVYLLYLRMHGPARESSEGRLFAAGPVLMLSWILGFILKDVV